MASFLDKVMPAGIEKMLKAVFEDVPERLAPKVMGKGLQGFQIIERLAITARESICALEDGTRFLHDGYLVYLNPQDYASMRGILKDLKTECLKTLQAIAQENTCLTKSDFTLEFLKSEDDETGQFFIDSYYKVSATETRLTSVGTMMRGVMSFEAEGFRVQESEWTRYHELFESMEAGRFSKVLEQLKAERLMGTGKVLGQVLACLCWLRLGRYPEAFRLLQQSKDLEDNEHGDYLRAIGYLAIGDPKRADYYLKKAAKRNLNPMGCMLQGLSYACQGKNDRAVKRWDLAFQDPVIAQAAPTLMSMLPKQDNTDLDQPILSITERGHGSHFLIAPSLPLGLKPGHLPHLLPCSKEEAAVFFEIRDQNIWVSGPKFTVNQLRADQDGHRLHDKDTIAIGSITLTYGQITFDGQWERSQRDFRRVCHYLKVSPYEIWFFPTDKVLTFGRASSNRGNDLILSHDAQISSIGHGEISWSNGHYYVTDLKSTNGIIKNKKKIKPMLPEIFNSGDILQMGTSFFQINYLDTK